MTIEPLEDGVYLSFGGNGLYYSIDDSEWVSLPIYTNTPSINIGQTMKIKGLNVITDSNYNHFTINGRCKLSGTIMSIIYGDEPYEEKLLFDSCFEGAFYNCTSIVEVASDFLPATTLTTNCYYMMFSGCTSLTTAPALPATTLAEGCYQHMFFDCSSLTTAPALPATKLASNCYDYMFYGCSKLTAAPSVLPATTLAEGCYSSMFNGCTSLTSAPELPATILNRNCYRYMFYNCSKLNYIKMLATDISATNCLNYWVYGVASTGTFVKNPDATWEVYGDSGIPNGWTVVMDGEEDVGGGFTANFFFDYCEDFGFYKQCERAPDDLGVACHNEAARLMELYGVESGHYYTSVDNPQRYGFNVTIEGAQVIEISKEYDTLFLHTGGEYQIVRIDRNGLIIYEL